MDQEYLFEFRLLGRRFSSSVRPPLKVMSAAATIRSYKANSVVKVMAMGTLRYTYSRDICSAGVRPLRMMGLWQSWKPKTISIPQKTISSASINTRTTRRWPGL